MPKIIFLILFSFFLFNCTKKEAEFIETDPVLLKEDRKKLDEIVAGYDVLLYKFIKIGMRSSIANDTQNSVPSSAQEKLNQVFDYIHSYQVDSLDLSVYDYISIYRGFNTVVDYIEKTDEDDFPTLLEISNKLSLDQTIRNKPFLTGTEKQISQSGEHAILSLFMQFSPSFTPNMVLYECSKTHPELHPDSEAKSLFMFYRGYVFFMNQLFYLSENEMNQNIKWLTNNPDIELPVMDFIFQWNDLSKVQRHKAYLSFNYLFRGFSRLMMEDKNSNKRGLDDFGVFIETAKELGIDNELVWAIEAYVYVKNEDSKKAIEALTKLKKSDLIGKNEQNTIEEAIGYLEKRKNEKVLNTIYDNVFLGKMASNYMLNTLVGADWQKILTDNTELNTAEFFKKLDTFTEFTNNLTQYTTMEWLNKYENSLLEEGQELLNDVEKSIENQTNDILDGVKDLF